MNQSYSTTVQKELKLISQFEEGRLYRVGHINVVVLNGSFYNMGRQYGSLMQEQLARAYQELIQKPIFDQGIVTFEEEKEHVIEEKWIGVSRRYKEIFRGLVETSGMALDQLFLLNVNIYAFNIFRQRFLQEPGCSFIATWGDYTTNGSTVVGRNFDWRPWYNNIATDLTVTVLNPTDGSHSVSLVGYPGEIVSVVTVMNDAGLFLAKNSGPASMRQAVSSKRAPFLIEAIGLVLDCDSMQDLERQINTHRVDAPLVTNVADANLSYSFENAPIDVRRRDADDSGRLVSTNHYLLESWGIKTEETPTHSYRRYANLCALAQKYYGRIDAEVMMQIMDVPLHLGNGVFGEGATKPSKQPNDNNVTCYQVVAVPGDKTFWVRGPGYTSEWSQVDLDGLFA